MKSLIEHIHTLHTDFSVQNNTIPEWLKTTQKNALDRLTSIGFPSQKDEAWKYTSLKPLDTIQFRLPRVRQSAINEAYKCYINSSDINIVFVDGILSQELSTFQDIPPGLSITSLSETGEFSAPDIKKYFTYYKIDEEDAFVSLNRAFSNNVIHIKAAKKTTIGTTIHVLFVATESIEKSMCFPRLLVTAEENSSLAIQETYVGITDTPYLNNTIFDIFIHENAHVHHLKLQRESNSSFHINTSRILQKQDSSYESFVLTTGAQIARNNLSCVLDGKNGDTQLNALYIVSKKNHIDNATIIEHKAPHCSSNQLYKGILRDSSHGVFNGRIKVHKDAQETNARQLNKNLLLSKECHIDTKPQLEIDADNVQCTHGATIGQLQQDEVFYLQSRGIDEMTAASMLAQGFAHDVINRITSTNLRQKVLTEITGVV